MTRYRSAAGGSATSTRDDPTPLRGSHTKLAGAACSSTPNETVHGSEPIDRPNGLAVTAPAYALHVRSGGSVTLPA